MKIPPLENIFPYTLKDVDKCATTARESRWPIIVEDLRCHVAALLIFIRPARPLSISTRDEAEDMPRPATMSATSRSSIMV